MVQTSHVNPSQKDKSNKYTCSIIVPVYNGAQFLQECLLSVLSQKDIPIQNVELIIYDDTSTDNSLQVAQNLSATLSAKLGNVQILHGDHGPQGVGSARNRACEKSQSPVLVFLDADDIMREYRLSRSLKALQRDVNGKRAHIVGGVFDRIPVGSTPRYESYHRRLCTDDLFSHAFRDAPLAMPTITCLKEVWESVNGFREGRGVAEDLHFLYDAMKAEFRMVKLGGDSLTGYRFHSDMTSLTLHRRALLDVRVNAFEDLVLVLPNWKDGFSIWNSGRDGKEVFKRLSDHAKSLLRVWGDIDPRKIGKLQREREIVHFSKLKPPIACCVALDREGREFEANLATLNLRPGIDYVHLV